MLPATKVAVRHPPDSDQALCEWFQRGTQQQGGPDGPANADRDLGRPSGSQHSARTPSSWADFTEAELAAVSATMKKSLTVRLAAGG